MDLSGNLLPLWADWWIGPAHHQHRDLAYLQIFTSLYTYCTGKWKDKSILIYSPALISTKNIDLLIHIAAVIDHLAVSHLMPSVLSLQPEIWIRRPWCSGTLINCCRLAGEAERWPSALIQRPLSRVNEIAQKRAWRIDFLPWIKHWTQLRWPGWCSASLEKYWVWKDDGLVWSLCIHMCEDMTKNGQRLLPSSPFSRIWKWTTYYIKANVICEAPSVTWSFSTHFWLISTFSRQNATFLWNLWWGV